MRKKFNAKFKGQVALEAIKNDETIEQLSQRFGVHPTQIKNWKSQFLANAEKAFIKDNLKGDDREKRIAELERKVGQQVVELDFLKKNYTGYLKRNG